MAVQAVKVDDVKPGESGQSDANHGGHWWGLTFDMSGGPKGAKRPLERPLDGMVRCLRQGAWCILAAGALRRRLARAYSPAPTPITGLGAGVLRRAASSTRGPATWTSETFVYTAGQVLPMSNCTSLPGRHDLAK